MDLAIDGLPDAQGIVGRASLAAAQEGSARDGRLIRATRPRAELHRVERPSLACAPRWSVLRRHFRRSKVERYHLSTSAVAVCCSQRFPQFGEQTRVLDGDHGLGGKIGDSSICFSPELALTSLR